MSSSHHAFAATSAGVRPRVAASSNTSPPPPQHHKHSSSSNNSRENHIPPSLTVETMEQPLPQQHHHHTHPHNHHQQHNLGNAMSMTTTPSSEAMGELLAHSTNNNANLMTPAELDPNNPNNAGGLSAGLPTEPQLVLLCLDYLRDLRRAYPTEELEEMEGLNAEYLSLAIYALSRTFVRPASLVAVDNDCMMDPLKQPPFFDPTTPRSARHSSLKKTGGGGGGAFFGDDHPDPGTPFHNTNKSHVRIGDHVTIPSMAEINHEILYSENPLASDDASEDQSSHPPYQHNRHRKNGEEKKEDPEDNSDGKNNDGDEEDVENNDPYSWYDYDDMHPSNGHRFYPLSGLASGPSLKGPLTLGEIAAAGLAGLGARSRVEAEKDMIGSPLFEQFVQAVKSKGFFMDPDNDTPLTDPEEEQLRLVRAQKNYEDRYRKVVAKFRTKLAFKADANTPTAGGNTKPGMGSPMASANINMNGGDKVSNWLALSSADRQRRRREQALAQARWKKAGGIGPPQTPDRPGGSATPHMSPRGGQNTPISRAMDGADAAATNHHQPTSAGGGGILTPRGGEENHPIDIEQAERAKAEGNICMQKRMYPQAVQAYTQALKISPHGPHSHVYFSNRAAALLSMKKFPEAILDSERSLALKPDYGKAHARLGLAHFLSGNYRQAMEAYTVSLKYDPNNSSSKSYLEKAAKRLAEGSSTPQGPVQSSYSLVSEWESSQRKQEQQQSQHHHRRRSPSPHHRQHGSTTPTSQHREVVIEDRSTPEQQRDAEKFKAKGNAYMAHREYNLALDAYTQAIQCSPHGPQSHVYYSNRAAALCYLERYRDAVVDSEKSLELSPAYGKAHARLGLSRFFLQDYAGAVAAYTAALQYDPDNAASKSYLIKAKAKLEGRSSRPSSRSASPASSHRSSRHRRIPSGISHE